MNHADIYNTVRIALEGWWDFIPTGAINSVIEKLKKSGYLIDKEKEDEKVLVALHVFEYTNPINLAKRKIYQTEREWIGLGKENVTYLGVIFVDDSNPDKSLGG